MKSILKKNISLTFIGLSLILSSCKKEKLNPDLIKTIKIHSIYTESDYTIQVVLPDNYVINGKYETIYLLDGEEKVDVSRNTPFVYTANENARISKLANKQQVILVSIGGVEFRERDYTPTATSDFAPTGGGAEAYSNFLEKELIPEIQQQFSVDTLASSRVIIGHSLGGLLTAYLFVKHPLVFSNYITLSPSLNYDNEIIFQYEAENRLTNPSKSGITYIGFGELETVLGVYVQEWEYRVSTFYPNNKVMLNTSPYSHISSMFSNISKGLEFYYQNK